MWKKEWVVYAKQPYAGPEQVIRYLGLYTHRTAIGHERLLRYHDHRVQFRYRDSLRGNTKCKLTLEDREFVRRFLLHILPKGFMRIRHYGLLGNRCQKRKLRIARLSLNAPPPQPMQVESVREYCLRVAHIDIDRCAVCGASTIGRAVVIPPQRMPP